MIRELATMLTFPTKGLREAEAAFSGLRSLAQGVAQGVAQTMAAVGAGLAAALSIRSLVAAGDAATLQMNQLRASLQGVSGDAADVYEKLYGVARSTGVAMDAGVQGFSRIQAAVKELGGTPDQVLAVVEGLQQAGALAGAKAEDIAETTRQLGQALSSSNVTWEELGIISDRSPNLVRALAAELKIGMGDLKKMAGDGKILTKDVWPALIRLSGKFREDFERLTPTFSRSVGQLRVVWTRFLADLDGQLGLSQAIARNLQGVTRWIEDLRRRLPTVGEFTRQLGGIDQVLEVIAISAGVASLAMSGLLLKMIVPAAVVLGIATVGLALQDLWVWVRGRPSLMGDFFGDFGPVRDRFLAQFEQLKTALQPLIAAIKADFASLNLPSLDEASAEFQARFKTLIDNTKMEWQALVAVLTSDASKNLLTDTFGGMARDGEAMWKVVKPILDLLISGPADLARTWPPVAAMFADPLGKIRAYFDELDAAVNRVSDTLRAFLGLPSRAAAAAAAMNLSPENADRMRRATEEMQRRQGVAGERLNRPATPAVPMPEPGSVPFNGRTIGPASYNMELPGRMNARPINASYVPRVQQTIVVNATGVNPTAVAAAAQSGVNRANRDAQAPGEGFARGIGFDFARTEAAS